jgi:hypothetical protein
MKITFTVNLFDFVLDVFETLCAIRSVLYVLF